MRQVRPQEVFAEFGVDGDEVMMALHKAGFVVDYRSRTKADKEAGGFTICTTNGGDTRIDIWDNDGPIAFLIIKAEDAHEVATHIITCAGRAH